MSQKILDRSPEAPIDLLPDLCMLWGKNFEWSPSARDALEVMVELNNRFAIDGRNPNSYSGIFWCLGRYDSAWGPERPIYGKVRYMTLDSTRWK